VLFYWVYDAFSLLGSVILGDTVFDILICIVTAGLSSGSLDGSTYDLSNYKKVVDVSLCICIATWT
jgi:hypothetical protein